MMLPAEQKSYRRGLTLGLTVAETFSVVVFILLLACAVLLGFERSRGDRVESERDVARVDLEVLRDALEGGSNGGDSRSSTRVWLRYTHHLRDSLNALGDQIGRLRRDLESEKRRVRDMETRLTKNGEAAGVDEEAPGLAHQRDSLRRELDNAQWELSAAETQLEDMQMDIAKANTMFGVFGNPDSINGWTLEKAAKLASEVTHARALREQTEAAMGVFNRLHQDLERANAQIDSMEMEERSPRCESATCQQSDSLSALMERLWQNERERRDLLNIIGYLGEEFGGSGGIDPPPCWVENDAPQYIFRIEIMDEGMRMFDISPSDKIAMDDDARRYVSEIQEGVIYSPGDFLRVTQPFLSLGVLQKEKYGPKGCRYWIEPIDLTGDRKDVFKARESQLWRRFWFRW